VTTNLSREEALRYIRAKIDQLLSVMGTLPLRPEELDDETLIALDPIGIIAESFRQVIEHLNTTNERLALASAEIRSILDTLGAAVVVLDQDDRFEDCNQQALDWFFHGQEKSALAGRRPEEVCSLSTQLAEFRRSADGSTRFMQLYGHDMQIVASQVLDSEGRHAKTVMLFSDITQQKDIERHLKLYSEVFRHIGEGIMITDADNRIIEVNDAVSHITGYSRDELLGNTPSCLKSGLHENSFYAELWLTLRTTGHWKGEIYDRTRRGQIVPLLASISAVRDAEGKLTHHIAVITDISSFKETQRRLDFLAHHDPLTNLPNRLLFNDRLQHAIERARRDRLFVALLFIDLDHFKTVNDTLGHQVGDLLLIEIAKQFNALIRSADTLARLGGDEFVILMEALPSPLAAAHVADKLVAKLKQPFNINGLSLHISCSIGITLYPEDGEDAATLMKNADAAMYRAKEAGRDGFFRYSTDLSVAIRDKLTIDDALRHAVATNDFELHYQPIIDVACNRIVGCEALIRWPHGPENVRSPAQFIPVAEETRLIIPLGEWVMHQALSQLHAWNAMGIAPSYVSVNVSALQLSRTDFVDDIVAALAKFDLPGHMLQVELTENAMMADLELCSWVFSQLREHGIRIAIDDFGTGYSSLSYLKHLPIDILKIDRSFVRDIPGDPDDCAIAAAIIGLARTLWLDVIAEGIETEAQQTFLTSNACTKLQGYLHARPMSASDYANFAGRMAPTP